MTTTQKRCERCKFVPVFGRQRVCPACKKSHAVEKARRRYLRVKGTPEFMAKQREYARLYRLENKEAVNARRRKRRAERRDYVNAVTRAWYATHKDRLNAARRTPEGRAYNTRRQRAWREQNPGYARRRRAMFAKMLKGVGV